MAQEVEGVAQTVLDALHEDAVSFTVTVEFFDGEPAPHPTVRGTLLTRLSPTVRGTLLTHLS